jgi:hypothetical protein
MYKVDINSGRIFDADGVEVPQDDRVDSYRAYILWLSGDRTPEPFDAPPVPEEPEAELSSAQEWGVRLVRAFEAAALKGGINGDPAAALALDRYLREVSGAVAAGRLHVAYAALGELLTTAERERPAPPFTDDASLVPIYNALAERLKLEPWSKR